MLQLVCILKKTDRPKAQSYRLSFTIPLLPHIARRASGQRLFYAVSKASTQSSHKDMATCRLLLSDRRDWEDALLRAQISQQSIGHISRALVVWEHQSSAPSLGLHRGLQGSSRGLQNLGAGQQDFCKHCWARAVPVWQRIYRILRAWSLGKTGKASRHEALVRYSTIERSGGWFLWELRSAIRDGQWVLRSTRRWGAWLWKMAWWPPFPDPMRTFLRYS